MRSILSVLPLFFWAVTACAQPSLWFDGTTPKASAAQAVALLISADSHGLDPDDYAAPALASALRGAAGRPFDAASAAHIEQQLTAAMLRYLTDLHAGRIAPRELPHGYDAPARKSFDAAALLQRALAEGTLAQVDRHAAPRIAQYEQLRAALARFRTLVGHAAWDGPLPALPRPKGADFSKLEPGAAWAGLPRLRERLIALGDLDRSVPESDTYDAALVEAMKTFQARHGLTADGIVGRATLAQLQVPPSARVRQIELSLERLRWTPLLSGPRMIVINIPEFVLRAYEVQGERIVVRSTMKVIVGKALDTRTPLFEEHMRYVEFSPFWNVPPSIARAEVVPRLRRDPGYWQREGFEFVTASGAAVEALSPALLDATLQGAARIRQRPGPRNALGDIKFVFPNRDHIFLHHTPSVGLFDRDRRDFSHGCIRVEQPVALAMFVLSDMPDWTEERVRAAMGAGRSTTLALAEPVPVLIAYGTAIVRGGKVHFFDDVYGQDRALDAALRRPRPPLVPGP